MCQCNNQPYPCQLCSQEPPCKEGCPIQIDTSCVQYTGELLSNINIDSGDWLQDILVKLNDFTFAETVFSANSTNTIVATANGTKGHSPFYSVRLDPTNNALTQSPTGLKAPLPDGKVKVNSGDILDYLENQLTSGSDGIITVTPVTIGGLIYLVPSINKTALISLITDDICGIASACIPAGESTTNTTSTSSTSTSSTTSSSTTITTTQAPNEFVINNISGQGLFDITLRDEVSLINYIYDNSTNNNQVTSLQYTGSSNESDLIIQHGGNVPVGVNITVDGIVIYNSLIYIGSITLNNVSAKSDIVVILYPYVGTTTTSTTSTTTTSTTTQAPCVTYSITNSSGSSKSYSYLDCQGIPFTGLINNSTTIPLCVLQGSLTVGVGVSMTLLSTGCNLYDYYTANRRSCSTCGSPTQVVVSFYLGTGVTLGHFYTPTPSDGYSYELLASTVGPENVSLVNSTHNSTCELICNLVTTTTTNTTTDTTTNTTTDTTTNTTTDTTTNTTTNVGSTMYEAAQYTCGTCVLTNSSVIVSSNSNSLIGNQYYVGIDGNVYLIIGVLSGIAVTDILNTTAYANCAGIPCP